MLKIVAAGNCARHVPASLTRVMRVHARACRARARVNSSSQNTLSVPSRMQLIELQLQATQSAPDVAFEHNGASADFRPL